MSSRRMLLGARLETGSTAPPRRGERSNHLIHPAGPTACPPGAARGAVPHLPGLIRSCQSTHKLAAGFLHANPCFCEALRSLPTPCLDGTGSCCMGGPEHICLLWGSPQPAKALFTLACTGIDNFNTTNSKWFFFPEKAWPQTYV